MKLGPNGIVFAAVATLAIAIVLTGSALAGNAGAAGAQGTLVANITIGPTQPVCYVNATTGPAGSTWSSVKVVITSASGQSVSLPVSWESNGCSVFGSVSTALAPGAYSVSLSGWTPIHPTSQELTIVSRQTTTLNLNYDTGIR